jgi:hypothetical protein
MVSNRSKRYANQIPLKKATIEFQIAPNPAKIYEPHYKTAGFIHL